MKIKCVFNRASDVFFSLQDPGYTEDSIFDIEIEREYVVYGMCISVGDISCLIDNGHGGVYWYPLVLFEVIDGRMPGCWFFSMPNGDNGEYMSAIWGYYELAMIPDHFEALVDGERGALLIFAKRRLEIEEYEKTSIN